MLALLWSDGLLFTAIITRTLNKTVKGQVTPLKEMQAIEQISTGTLLSISPSMCKGLLVTFGSEKLSMFANDRERLEFFFFEMGFCSQVWTKGYQY